VLCYVIKRLNDRLVLDDPHAAFTDVEAFGHLSLAVSRLAQHLHAVSLHHAVHPGVLPCPPGLATGENFRNPRQLADDEARQGDGPHTRAGLRRNDLEPLPRPLGRPTDMEPPGPKLDVSPLQASQLPRTKPCEAQHHQPADGLAPRHPEQSAHLPWRQRHDDRPGNPRRGHLAGHVGLHQPEAARSLQGDAEDPQRLPDRRRRLPPPKLARQERLHLDRPKRPQANVAPLRQDPVLADVPVASRGRRAHTRRHDVSKPQRDELANRRVFRQGSGHAGAKPTVLRPGDTSRPARLASSEKHRNFSRFLGPDGT
jgi:hypothetical protein